MKIWILGALALIPSAAQAKTKVACTLTSVEAIVKEIGGDRVDTFSLSAGDQDPHFVAPTPVLMKKVREADLMMEVGMQLELWADEVANGSGNPRLFKGAPGRVTLSTGVPRLEIPDVLSRSQGDIHPEGNPHIWLDPARAKIMAANAAKALKAAQPDGAAYFDQRLKDFDDRVDKSLFGEQLLKTIGTAKLTRLLIDGRLYEFLEANSLGGKKLIDMAGGWVAKARPLRNQKTLEFHKVWAYFARSFGFELVGTIEEKPGIPPGPRHVADTIAKAKADAVKLILVDNFYNPSLPKRIASEAGATVVVLPNQVRGEKNVDDYFKLIDHVLDAMVAALGRKA